MVKNFILVVCSFCVLVITSCGDDDTERNVIESFDVNLDSSNAIPQASERNENGVITMSLFDDNSLDFSISIDNLSASDALTVAHIHMGDVVSTGPVAIGLVDGTEISFDGGTANGTVTLTDAEMAILQGEDIYVNVHSMERPSGVVRGQVGQIVDSAFNVELSPINEIPVVEGRDETGTATFRIIGSTMYYRITVSELGMMDFITAGHIHAGSSADNGGVLINLDIVDDEQLDVTKTLTLEESEITILNNDELYVNIHSNLVPSGLMRGQIR